MAATALLGLTLLLTMCVLVTRKASLDIDDTQTTPTADLHEQYLRATKINRRRAEIVYYLMLAQGVLPRSPAGSPSIPSSRGSG